MKVLDRLPYGISRPSDEDGKSIEPLCNLILKLNSFLEITGNLEYCTHSRTSIEHPKPVFKPRFT